ncbi:MAG: hypothetical protein ACLP74_08690 [Thermoplasmata archaeon]
MPTARGPTALGRAAAFFRRHPVLLLLTLTPGIPEYLSGSSPVALIAVSPPGFFLFLLLNLGLYGPGVLLLREAWVRWGKSWGSLLLFGAAYALLEEGTALSTLFNPNASVVGSLGHYGRFAGVNWVWLIGILGVHIVLSVGLPIVLLGLALPGTRGRPFLTRREATAAVAIYGVDIVLLALIEGFWRVELAWIVGAVLVAGLLWLVAVRLPTGWLDPPQERPKFRPGTFFFLGLAFFPLLILVPGLGAEGGLPAFLSGAIELVVAAALFLAVRRSIGRRGNEPHLVLLALGTTLPFALAGLVSQIGLPVVLVVDMLYGLFFWTLWRRYRPVPSSGPPTASPDLAG